MTKHRFRLLKNCTRGKKGEPVEVHANDIRPLQANGVIGTVEIQPHKPTETKKKKTKKKAAKK